MKRILFNVIALLVSVLGFIGCGTKSILDNDASTTELSIAMLMPEAVEPGGVLSITGSKLNTVTAVVFPGNQTVTSFHLVGETQLDVTVPMDVKAGSVEITDGQVNAVSAQHIRVANPRVTGYAPVDIKTREILVIKGEDLGVVAAVRFGDIEVLSKEFARKNDAQIKVMVPGKTPLGDGLTVSLVNSDGRTINVGKINVAQGIPEEIWVPLMDKFPIDLGDWDNSIYISKKKYGKFLTEDTIFKINYTPTKNNIQFKICSDDQWSGFMSVSNNSWGGIDLKGDVGKEYEFKFSLKDRDIAELMGTDNLVVQGKNAVINQIFYLKEE